MAQASDTIRSRVSDKWSPELRATITRALAASDLAYDARKPSGRPADTQRERDADKVALLNQLASHAGPMVRKAEIELKRHKDRLDMDRAALIDKALTHDTPRDAALAKEMREHLKSLPDNGARMKLCLSSKLAARACLETDPVLSGGLPSENLHAVLDSFLTQHYPADSAALAERATAVETADASLRLAQGALARAADLPASDYAQFYDTMAPAKI